MTQRTRKFWGIWLILFWLVVYPLCMAAFFSEWLMWMPTWAALVFFLIAGLAWAIPAGMIIKWMAKPDIQTS